MDIIVPETCFYIESGGQVSDQGVFSNEGKWKVEITDVRRPATGVIVHSGKVISGIIHEIDDGILQVDEIRRRDIMRNHTATHLLHAALQTVLGSHARQAGSLVAPDKLRFDFTHPEAMTTEQVQHVQDFVNEEILHGHELHFEEKQLSLAMEEGATALFGEKYGDIVRTVTIPEKDANLSYELCGGTHVGATNDIGLFLITSEGSAAAGIRRIEAVTGRGAYGIVRNRLATLTQVALHLDAKVEEVSARVDLVLEEMDERRKAFSALQQELVLRDFVVQLDDVPEIAGVPVLAVVIQHANSDILRVMTDRFRDKYKSGVVVLGTVSEDKPVIVASVTEDLILKGITASEIVKTIAPIIGGSGGGRPNMAQAGGKDPSRLDEALQQVNPYLKRKLG